MPMPRIELGLTDFQSALLPFTAHWRFAFLPEKLFCLSDGGRIRTLISFIWSEVFCQLNYPTKNSRGGTRTPTKYLLMRQAIYQLIVPCDDFILNEVPSIFVLFPSYVFFLRIKDLHLLPPLSYILVDF